ncbi:hypothetical protein KORDIASMS9_00004 [Kordia sp. SMS9]|uniref:hypothetical protein n=1 Tax=Kordia sp. SMS9 TaxID=2282170 RepID=UPI000E0CFC49|nr:hypothetical protein [Kordia sp. SMS9]AXG67822.1 hypothetical protein KORDIASMS9_00004 [Kordia sp. SMS9]
MKKLNLLCVLFIGLLVISCASDDDTQTITEGDPQNSNGDPQNVVVQKLLSFSSSLTDSNEIEFMTQLTYTNDNLTKITENYINIGENVWNYSYTDNELTAVNSMPITYANGVLVVEYEFERDEYFILNNQVLSQINSFRNDPSEAFQFSFKVEYNYTDNNITEKRYLDENDVLTGSTTYEYDTKNNILKGLDNLNKWIFPYADLLGGANNNITSRKEFDENGTLLRDFSYQYEYDSNDFPTKRIRTFTSNGTSTVKTNLYTYE